MDNLLKDGEDIMKYLSKLSPEEKAEILQFKELRGQPLPDDPDRNVSAYTVAELYNVTPRTIYKLWEPEKYASKKKMVSPDTELLEKMVTFFSSILEFIPADLKTDFLAILDEAEKARIKELSQ